MTRLPMFLSDRALVRARQVPYWPSHPPDNISTANEAHCFGRHRFERQRLLKPTTRPLHLRVRPRTFFASPAPCLFFASLFDLDSRRLGQRVAILDAL